MRIPHGNKLEVRTEENLKTSQMFLEGQSHLAKLTVDSSAKSSNWENPVRSQVNEMNIDSAIGAGRVADLGKEVDPI